jgi:hypothetical protein
MITRRTAAALLVSAVAAPRAAFAHNNPSFDTAVVAEVAVEPAAGQGSAHSAPFSLELPPRTIQLHYEVVSDERDSIRFAVAAGADQVAAELQHEGRSPPIKTGPLTIVSVSGATAPFTIRIIAEYVVKRSA